MYNNSWDKEAGITPPTSSASPSSASDSNKQEVVVIDDKPLHAPGTSIDIPPEQPEEEEEPYHKPSLPRLLLRVWQFFAAIGAFGFQVGASLYSSEQTPFSKKDLLYYGYVICWISVIWSCFNIFVYMSRRFGKGGKIKRFISTLFDLCLAALFGVNVFYEIAIYRCKPGTHQGYCDFYNTGLFFLMTLFFTYVIHALWDIFGPMYCLRKK